jgi:hypothetical protein
MPSMASLVVKKADETTNITYDALTPAAGDRSPAVWRQDTGAVAGLPTGYRAKLTMVTMNNGPATARRAVLEYKRPYAVLNTTTGRYESKDADVARLELTLPEAIPGTERSESVRQFLNLAAATLIKQAAETGYSPA